MRIFLWSKMFKQLREYKEESFPEEVLNLSRQCTFQNHGKHRSKSQCHSAFRSGTRVLFLPYSRHTYLKKINRYHDRPFATRAVVMASEKHRVQQSGLPEHNVQYRHKERDSPDCGTHHVCKLYPRCCTNTFSFF